VLGVPVRTMELGQLVSGMRDLRGHDGRLDRPVAPQDRSTGAWPPGGLFPRARGSLQHRRDPPRRTTDAGPAPDGSTADPRIPGPGSLPGDPCPLPPMAAARQAVVQRARGWPDDSHVALLGLRAVLRPCRRGRGSPADASLRAAL